MKIVEKRNNHYYKKSIKIVFKIILHLLLWLYTEVRPGQDKSRALKTLFNN